MRHNTLSNQLCYNNALNKHLAKDVVWLQQQQQECDHGRHTQPAYPLNDVKGLDSSIGQGLYNMV